MPKPIHYNKRSKFDPTEPTPHKTKRPEQPGSTLAKFLLTNIGTPDDLLDVDVKPLWGASFRVNMYREVRGRRTLTDSFFLQVVQDGVIANPPLARRYHDDML
jgi:hypothetical protein